MVTTVTTTITKTVAVTYDCSQELPQNLLITPDETLEGFESIGDWTVSSGSAAADTTNYKVGTQSIKMTTPSGGTATMEKTVNWSGLSTCEFVSLWLYIYNTTLSDIASWSVKISSTTDFSKYFSYTVSDYFYYMKWYDQRFHIPLSSMTNTNGESWSNTMIRVQLNVTAASGKTVNISFDDMKCGYKRIPVVMLYMDNASASWFTGGAVDYMNNLGLRATVFATQTNIRAAGGMSIAQAQSLHDAGWVIGNHGLSATGVSFGDWLTQTEVEYQIGAAQAFVRDYLGCAGGERYGSYMGGGVIYDSLLTRPAFVACEALLARQGQGYARPPYYPPGDFYNIESGANYSAASLGAAGCETAIDNAITRGQYLMLGWEDIDGSGMSTEDFETVMDYIYDKWQDGLIYPITFHDFYRLQFNSIVIPNTGYKSNTESNWSEPAELFNFTHESNNFRQYDNTVTNSGNLSVSAAAALNSTNYGLSVNFPGGTTTAKYARKTLYIYPHNKFRIRLYFDPNGVTLDTALIWLVRLSDDYTGYSPLTVRVGYTGGNYYIRATRINDDTQAYTYTNQYTITDAPHYIEVYAQRESSDGAADGSMALYIDGDLKETLTSINDYNSWLATNGISIGACSGVGTGVSGTYYLDEIKANTDGSAIGA